MPEPWRGTLIRLGRLGAYDDPEYLDAVAEFYHRHLCRLDPYPECVERSLSQLPNQVYLTMNGPTEFDVIGSLRTWDRRADLGRITVPTLVTVGRYDEIPILCSQTLVDGIAGAHVAVFDESAHMAHEEEPDRYAAAITAFLDGVDESPRSAAASNESGP